jgi:hypothetical protein
VEYVAVTEKGVVIVAQRGEREHSINVPRSEALELAAKLRYPLGKAKGRR